MSSIGYKKKLVR